MAVRIRMKKFGRRHRPFYRICAMDRHRPRNGKVLEELGTYDPMIADVDARALLNGKRISYWLSVGAQPSDKVKVLIKKYGTEGTHLERQKTAIERLAQLRQIPDPELAASATAQPHKETVLPGPQEQKNGASTATTSPGESTATDIDVAPETSVAAPKKDAVVPATDTKTPEEDEAS